MDSEVTATDKGVWITVKKGRGKPKLVQLIRYETIPGGGMTKVLTEDGADFIEDMASKGSVLSEIADILGITKNTLYAPHNKERTKAAYSSGTARCRDSLRHAQVSKALDGDSRMLVWLGKVMLGQKEQDMTASSELSEFVKNMNAVDGDAEEE